MRRAFGYGVLHGLTVGIVLFMGPASAVGASLLVVQLVVLVLAWRDWAA